jgi:hypothetical protein
MRIRLAAAATLIALTAGGCTSSPGSPIDTQPPAAAPATTQTQTATATTHDRPGQRICRIEADDGAFYLLLTSEADHNFSACDAYTPFDGTLEDLFKLPHNMDRRCFLASDKYIAQNGASGAIYSDAVKADLAAAHAFCAANGGTT